MEGIKLTEKLFDVHFLINSIPEILKYLPVTLSITIIALIAGLLIGFLVALIKIYKVPVLKYFTAIYVSYIRGTPLLVQIYLSYYGLPILLQYVNLYFGTDININSIAPIIFIFIAYSLNEGAYASETIRGAIEAVDKGQIEAAHSIGMTSFQTLRRIIIPEALKVALPNLGNNLLGLIKGTSLAFSISVVDIVAAADIIGARSYRFFEVYIIVALIYWITCTILSRLVTLIEKRVKVSERGVVNDRT